MGECLIEVADLATASVVVIDCRYSLQDKHAGRTAYEAGHIPDAFYFDLGTDLSAPVQPHGGRHPLPPPEVFATKLANCGIEQTTNVVVYDDQRMAFAARLWWMMRSLGYRPPRILNGGYQAWLAAGGVAAVEAPRAQPKPVPDKLAWRGVCDINQLREAQQRNALLIDSREPKRYQGLEEPIDPIAGHIPGAVNHPWQAVVDDEGVVATQDTQRQAWGEHLQADGLVVYCGSGVTACVNLFSLAMLGRSDAQLYAGSWSDWCSYLEPPSTRPGDTK